MAARLVTAVLLLAICCCACSPDAAPTATPTVPTSNLVKPTPTFTTLPLPPQVETATPEPVEFTGGEIELVVNFQVDEGIHECTSSFPFTQDHLQDPPRISGEGEVDCHFSEVLEGEGGSVTHHTLLQYSGQVAGVLYPGTSDKPAGFLDCTLTLDGTMSEYFSDYPGGSFVPYTAANPFEISGADSIPLPFEWKEGSTVVITPPTAGASANRWTFILHLY
jgi:hypothetical protein